MKRNRENDPFRVAWAEAAWTQAKRRVAEILSSPVIFIADSPNEVPDQDGARGSSQPLRSQLTGATHYDG